MNIQIYGEIGGWGVTASELNWELSDVPADTPIAVEIHSGGGDVFEGLAIYSALQSFSDVTVEVVGIAASMATVIMQAASAGKLTARAHTMLMVHAPSMYSYGGKKDKEQDAKLLQQIEVQTAAIMAKRMGLTVEEFTAKYYDGADHWFTADEAQAAGLIDAVTHGFDDGDMYDGIGGVTSKTATQINQIIKQNQSSYNHEVMTKQEYDAKIAEQSAAIEALTAKVEKLEAVEALAAEFEVKAKTDIEAFRSQVATLTAALAKAKGMTELEQKLVARSQDAETIQMVLDAEPAQPVAPAVGAATAVLKAVTATATADPLAGLGYKELSAKHPQYLAKMQKEDPARFNKLLAEYVKRK